MESGKSQRVTHLLALHCKMERAKSAPKSKSAPMSLGSIWPPGGVLPYLGYICMCGPKGYGFSAVLVINRVSILADFGHFGHK